MLKRQLRRMQKNSRHFGTAVERIAQNGKSMLRRVHSNLMRPASDRFGLHQRFLPLLAHDGEMCLGALGSGLQRAAQVFLPHANNG